MSMLTGKDNEARKKEEIKRPFYMEKIRLLVFLAAAVFVIFIAAGAKDIGKSRIYGGKDAGHLEKPVVRRAEFNELIENRDSFVIMFARASCRQCSVVEYVLSDLDTGSVPFYIFDLEAYYGSDEYEELKSMAGITYVPTFLYYEEGERKYCMNNPLPDGYFEDSVTAEERTGMRKDTAERIVAFFKGITGEGEVIDEAPLTDIVAGVSETNGSGG